MAKRSNATIIEDDQSFDRFRKLAVELLQVPPKRIGKAGVDQSTSRHKRKRRRNTRK